MITGKYLKSLRESSGLTQTELARMANISQAHIARIESEKVDPRLSTVNSILAILTNTEKAIACRDIMSRKIVSVKPGENAKKAVRLMKSFGISQIPVIEGAKVVGSISEGTIIKHLDKNLAYVKVSEIMDEPFPVVSEDSPADMLKDLLEFNPAVLVSTKGKITGIITKFDLLGSR